MPPKIKKKRYHMTPAQAESFRAKENEIHELKSKLLFAEQPFRATITKLEARIAELTTQLREQTEMLLWCPACGERHIDEGEFATKVHHTHACQHCGMVWRPSLHPTVGVKFLPGFKNA